jgi:type II secretory pathway component GspD/PulD (secretin)
MIYDGETVIIAGVATDLTEIVHDKIPILGDIPFIGRFFQSKYTSSKKGNLLIFLTCRLVKPDGTAWRASTKTRRGIHTYDNL